MKRLLVLICMFGLMVGIASASLLEMEITDGTNTALINSAGSLVTTGSASGTDLVLPGSEIFAGTVGNYVLNIDTATGSPVLKLGSLKLTAQDTSGPVSGPLTIEFSENGITTPFPGWNMAFGGSWTAFAKGDNATLTAYEDNGNGFFATTNTIGTIGPLSPNALGDYSGDKSGGVLGVTAPYSLTEQISISATGSASFGGDASLTPVPEPAGIMLLGAGLLALGMLRRRMVKQ